MSHAALRAAKSLRAELTPNGNIEGAFQWGKVNAVHTSPNTVDVFLDGSAVLTTGLKYLASYTPTVNDIVFIARMAARANTARVVLGKLS